jgi:hypothetical protein
MSLGRLVVGSREVASPVGSIRCPNVWQPKKWTRHLCGFVVQFFW